MSEKMKPRGSLMERSFPRLMISKFHWWKNFRKNKWLLSRIRHSHSHPDQYFFNIQMYIVITKMVILMLITHTGEADLDTFQNNMSQQISIQNQHVIRTRIIQVAQVLCCPIAQKYTGLSDLHKLVHQFLKQPFQNLNLKK